MPFFLIKKREKKLKTRIFKYFEEIIIHKKSKLLDPKLFKNKNKFLSKFKISSNIYLIFYYLFKSFCKDFLIKLLILTSNLNKTKRAERVRPISNPIHIPSAWKLYIIPK